jgi:hypothetical protein
MDDAQLFINVAFQSGYGVAAASAALAWAQHRLSDGRAVPSRFYIFRSASHGGDGAGQAPALNARPRMLLAFASADAALGFAQAVRLGAAPRLAAMGLGQLLAALIQRPMISALLVADDHDGPITAGLPAGLRIERVALLDQLQIADCRL